MLRRVGWLISTILAALGVASLAISGQSPAGSSFSGRDAWMFLGLTLLFGAAMLAVSLQTKDDVIRLCCFGLVVCSLPMDLVFLQLVGGLSQ